LQIITAAHDRKLEEIGGKAHDVSGIIGIELSPLGNLLWSRIRALLEKRS
jgi:hypothetical protein